MTRKTLPLLLLAASLVGAADLPQWVRDAAAQKPPAYPPKVTMVVLLNDEQLTVEPDGRRTIRERGAIRFLQDRHNQLRSYRPYDRRSDRIRDFQAWLVDADGSSTAYNKNAIVDQVLDPSNTYDELRVRSVECTNAPRDSVFAWEIVKEEKNIFTQETFTFQDSSPVLVARYTVTLPSGWDLKDVLLNHAPMKPAVSGSTYVWELRDLPWIEGEAHRPGTSALAPRLLLTWIPGAGGDPSLHPVRTWAELSTWFTPTSDAAAAVTPEIQAKAEELTRGKTTEVEKIAALARFAQQVNYVSIETNLSKASGYVPRPASKTLARNYGDCKDKATLMRAMLSAIGIGSHLVSISATDRRYVREEWPSPHQFNHAILAVRVSPATKLPATIETPTLGRLLFFDPTSELTPLGDLPEDEQGAWALVQAGDKGQLVRAPLLPAANNRVEMHVTASMNADGILRAKLTQHYFGQSARHIRSLLRNTPADQRQAIFERALSSSLGGVQVKKCAPVDNMEQGTAQVDLEFDLTRFGQMLRQRLLMLKPGMLGAAAPYRLPVRERKWPMELTAQVSRGTVELTLPDGFLADEIPDPVKRTSPYGTYQAEWKVTGNLLRFEETLEVKDLLAPANEYAKVREFFDGVAAAQQSPVVLLKKP